MRLLHVPVVAFALGVLGELNSTHAQGNLPPRITPTVSLQSQAVFVGQRSRFAVTASGSAPVTYQWRLDGQALPGKTNAALVVDSAQAADEGEYTVVVSNPFGAVTNDPPARLHVVPTNAFVEANSTNQLGTRLPFFYELPANYNPAHSYPLVNSYALFHVFSSNCRLANTPGGRQFLIAGMASRYTYNLWRPFHGCMRAISASRRSSPSARNRSDAVRLNGPHNTSKIPAAG